VKNADTFELFFVACHYVKYTTLNELFKSIRGENNLWQRVHLSEDQGGVIVSLAIDVFGESLQGMLHGAGFATEENYAQNVIIVFFLPQNQIRYCLTVLCHFAVKN
jgi:hypothetical protein